MLNREGYMLTASYVFILAVKQGDKTLMNGEQSSFARSFP
jgi:hypothetical protein